MGIRSCLVCIESGEQSHTEDLLNILNKPYFYALANCYYMSCLGKSFLYFIKNEQNGLIKIGYTKNLGARISTIKSIMKSLGLDAQCYILRSVEIPTFKVKRIEREAHIIFESHRIYGEWFDISEEDTKFYCDFVEINESFEVYIQNLICILRDGKSYDHAMNNSRYLELKKIIRWAKKVKLNIKNKDIVFSWELLKSDMLN